MNSSTGDPAAHHTGRVDEVRGTLRTRPYGFVP